MIRQATRYLRGATSSAALVVAAVVVAVILVVMVSTGASPISALGLGDDRQGPLVQVDSEQALDRNESNRARRGSGRGDRARSGRAGANERNRRRRNGNRSRQGSQSGPASSGQVTGEVVTDSSTGNSRGGSAGGGTNGDSSASGTSNPTQPRNRGGGGGGASGQVISDGSGGGGGTSGEILESGGGSATSQGNLAKALNDTVDTVDDTLGGTLSKTGLAEPVKKTTDALLGSDGTITKTVGGVTKGLGKLLGKKK